MPLRSSVSRSTGGNLQVIGARFWLRLLAAELTGWINGSIVGWSMNGIGASESATQSGTEARGPLHDSFFSRLRHCTCSRASLEALFLRYLSPYLSTWDVRLPGPCPVSVFISTVTPSTSSDSHLYALIHRYR